MYSVMLTESLALVLLACMNERKEFRDMYVAAFIMPEATFRMGYFGKRTSKHVSGTYVANIHCRAVCPDSSAGA
jgi:hypothetical protein